MAQKTIVLCVPWYSSLASPLQKAFEAHGFKIHLFDYRTIEGNLRYSIFSIVPILYGIIITIYQKKKISSKSILNSALLYIARRIEPSCIFFVKGETITIHTLEQLKKLRCTTICWQVDSVLQKEIWDKEKELSLYFDFYLTCEPGKAIEHVKNFGNKNVFYMLGAADKTSMKNSSHISKKYDISFVGSYNPMRELYLKQLVDKDLHIWGWGPWNKSSLSSFYHKKALSPEEMFETYKESKIVVNIGRVKESTIPTNLRPFEAAQVGAFILIEYKPNLKEVFNLGQEIDTFKNPKELKQKINYYLKNDKKREAMATALFKRVKKDHTYEKRLKKMFEYFKLERRI